MNSNDCNCAIGTLSPDFPIGEKDQILNELRFMMEHVSGSGKCAICKAISLIEKEDSKSVNDNSWMRLLVITFFAFMPFGNNSNSIFNKTFMDSFLETLQKNGEFKGKEAGDSE